MAQRSRKDHVATPRLGYFNYIGYATQSAISMSGVGAWGGSAAAWYHGDFLSLVAWEERVEHKNPNV